MNFDKPIVVPALDVAVSDIMARVFRKKELILGFLAVGVLHGLFYIHTTPPVYLATMVVAPSTQQYANEGMDPTGGGVGSLFQLASGQVDKLTAFQQYRFLLTSQQLADALDERHGALQVMFPHLWNTASGQWERPPSALNMVKDTVKLILGMPLWHPPTAQDLQSAISGKLSIKQEDIQAAYRISFKDRNPQVALDFLSHINEEANAIIAEEAQQQTMREIAFLERQLSVALPLNTRNSLTRLLSERLEMQTVLTGNFEYGAKVIDPPTVPRRPISPRPIPSMLVAIVAYALAAVAVVVFGLDERLKQIVGRRLQAARRSYGQRPHRKP